MRGVTSMSSSLSIAYHMQQQFGCATSDLRTLRPCARAAENRVSHRRERRVTVRAANGKQCRCCDACLNGMRPTRAHSEPDNARSHDNPRLLTTSGSRVSTCSPAASELQHAPASYKCSSERTVLAFAQQWRMLWLVHGVGTHVPHRLSRVTAASSSM